MVTGAVEKSEEEAKPLQWVEESPASESVLQGDCLTSLSPRSPVTLVSRGWALGHHWWGWEHRI